MGDAGHRHLGGKTMPVQINPSTLPVELQKVSVEKPKVIRAGEAPRRVQGGYSKDQVDQLNSAIGAFLHRPLWRKITFCL